MQLYEKMDTYAGLAADDLGCERAFVSIQSGDVLRSLGMKLPKGEFMQRALISNETICPLVIQSDTTLAITDARAKEEFRSTEYVAAGLIVGYLGVPIRLTGHGPIGTLNLVTRQPRIWTKVEIKYLENLSECIQLSIERELTLFEVDGLRHQLRGADALELLLADAIKELVSVYDTQNSLVFASQALWKAVDPKLVTEVLPKELSKVDFDATGKSIRIAVETKQEGKAMAVNLSRYQSGLTLASWHIEPKESVLH